MKTFKEFSDEFADDNVVYYGPGHIVFDDGALEDHNIHFCMAACELLLTDVSSRKKNYAVLENLPDEQVTVIALLLLDYMAQLLKLTEDERYVLYGDD